MAWPNADLEVTYNELNGAMQGIKRLSQDVRTEALGNLPAPRVITIYVALNGWKSAITSSGGTPGIVEYVRFRKNLPSLDVVAEATAVIAAIDGVLGWVSANFPRDTDGYMLYQKFENNTTVDRTFASGTTAALRTLLDTLIATIN